MSLQDGIRVSFQEKSSQNRSFASYNPDDVKHITRLTLALVQLCDHKSKYIFQDTLNHSHNCGSDVETLTHYLLCYTLHIEMEDLNS